MRIEVRLYATLREHAPPEAVSGVFATAVPSGATLADLIAQIGVAPEQVHLRMVNGAAADDDRILHENDRVGLFPPVGGG